MLCDFRVSEPLQVAGFGLIWRSFGAPLICEARCLFILGHSWDWVWDWDWDWDWMFHLPCPLPGRQEVSRLLFMTLGLILFGT